MRLRTGIGLAVCKRIRVESAAGAGSTFSFFLPAGATAPAGPTAEAEAP